MGQFRLRASHIDRWCQDMREGGRERERVRASESESERERERERERESYMQRERERERERGDRGCKERLGV